MTKIPIQTLDNGVPPFSLLHNGNTYRPRISVNNNKRKCQLHTTEKQVFMIWGQVLADTLEELNNKIYNEIILKEDVDYDIVLYIVKKD